MQTKTSREWAINCMLADLEQGVDEAFAAQQAVISEFISLTTILHELEGETMTAAQQRKYRALNKKLGGDTPRKADSKQSPCPNDR